MHPSTIVQLTGSFLILIPFVLVQLKRLAPEAPVPAAGGDVGRGLPRLAGAPRSTRRALTAGPADQRATRRCSSTSEARTLARRSTAETLIASEMSSCTRGSERAPLRMRKTVSLTMRTMSSWKGT